ncbi:hypothetical protein LJB42_001568 [Komagataella kurtzmanii]|nr:hypothetical protein LJB42_001568 [Komagataella kurtzmanii]
MLFNKFAATLLSAIAAVNAISLPSIEQAREHVARGLVPQAFADALDPALEKRADYMCHMACGLAIYGAWECGPEAGPFDSECLCAADSSFSQQVAACNDCGWCLYQSYYGYLAGPLDTCGLPITPTGTQCAETATTLTPTIGPFQTYTPTSV